MLIGLITGSDSTRCASEDTLAKAGSCNGSRVLQNLPQSSCSLGYALRPYTLSPPSTPRPQAFHTIPFLYEPISPRLHFQLLINYKRQLRRSPHILISLPNPLLIPHIPLIALQSPLDKDDTNLF